MKKYTAEEALRHTSKNKFAKWPRISEAERWSSIFKPSTHAAFSMRAGESVFTIGSCFARHIEMALAKHNYIVPALSFKVDESELWLNTKMVSGILNKYTPHSMLNEIEFAFSRSDGDEYLIKVGDDLYLDSQLHTNVPVPHVRALERRREVRELYKKSIINSKLIIVTLGLVEAWWDNVTGIYWNEFPGTDVIKMHPGRFDFHVLDYNQCMSCISKLVDIFKSNGKSDVQIMITVSPVPLSRTFTSDDVVVANTYSKSVLRVVADEVSKNFDNVHYYPSFESVLNSAKETTWEDDGIHVNKDVVAFNVNRMIDVYGDAEK